MKGLDDFASLLAEVRACRLCEKHLPLGPRPTLRASPTARVLITGQAPGTKVHATGIPWNDASGDLLRQWLGCTREEFYDESRIAIVPMGFCYPGKGVRGDLPPRPECAPTWRARVLAGMPNIKLTLAIGQYAIASHLGKRRKNTLAETVRAWREYAPEVFPLVHPSPRNLQWRRRHPWFEEEVVPELRKLWHAALSAR